MMMMMMCGRTTHDVPSDFVLKNISCCVLDKIQSFYCSDAPSLAPSVSAVPTSSIAPSGAPSVSAAPSCYKSGKGKGKGSSLFDEEGCGKSGKGKGKGSRV